MNFLWLGTGPFVVPGGERLVGSVHSGCNPFLIGRFSMFDVAKMSSFLVATHTLLAVTLRSKETKQFTASRLVDSYDYECGSVADEPEGGNKATKRGALKQYARGLYLPPKLDTKWH